MADVNGLENKLDEVFVKKAPYQLPESAKKWIVQYLPYINLVLGIITLVAAYNLYHWATVANKLVDYANQFARAYGVPEAASSSRLTFWVWISLAVLTVQAVLYIAAYPGTKAKKKAGWDLLFYALIVNAVYGFATLFIDSYGGAGNFIGYLLGTVIGLYFLFQIRSYYLPKKKESKPAVKK